MHPLPLTLALEFAIAVPLVAAVHLMSLWLKTELGRWSETAQSIAMAAALVWVMSGGPRIAVLFWHQIVDLRVLVHEFGFRALDGHAIASMLPMLIAAASILLAASVLVAIVMEWHNPQPRRTPPRRK